MALRWATAGMALAATSAWVLGGETTTKPAEAKVYASWKAVIADTGLTAEKPAKDVTMFGRAFTFGAGRGFGFHAAGGGRIGVLTIRPATPAAQVAVSGALEKAGGSAAVLMTGTLSVTRATPPPPGPAITGVYRGPFHRFNVERCEIIPAGDVPARAEKLIADPKARAAFIRQAVPFTVGQVRVTISSLQVHPQNPRQPALTSGVVVGVKVTNAGKKPFMLPVPAVEVVKGKKTIAATHRFIRGGYLKGPAVVRPGARMRFYRWSFALAEPVIGGDEVTAKVTLTGPAGATWTHTEAVTVVTYGGRPKRPVLRPLPERIHKIPTPRVPQGQ